MIESLGGEVRRNARGAIERKAHRDADPVDAVDLRVSVLERHQVDVASAEKFEGRAHDRRTRVAVAAS
jgi:hypothetical protein